MARFDEIKEYLENLDEDSLYSIYSEYTHVTDNYDYEIFPNDEYYINDILADHDPYWILCRVYYGDYNMADDWFRFDGYGNLESFRNLKDYVDIDEMAEYIDDENDSLYDDNIEEILNSYEEEEEEEEEEDGDDL